MWEGEGRGGRGEGREDRRERGGKGGRGVGVGGEERKERGGKINKGREGRERGGEGRERRWISSIWLSKAATTLLRMLCLHVHCTTQGCPWLLRPQHTQHT